MAQDWRTRLFTTFRQEAQQHGQDVRFPVSFWSPDGPTIPVRLIANKLHVTVDDTVLRQLDALDVNALRSKLDPAAFLRWQSAAARIRDRVGRTIPLNTYSTGIRVPSDKERSTVELDVYTCFVRLDDLQNLLTPEQTQTARESAPIGAMRIRDLGLLLWPAAASDTDVSSEAEAQAPTETTGKGRPIDLSTLRRTLGIAPLESTADTAPDDDDAAEPVSTPLDDAEIAPNDVGFFSEDPAEDEDGESDESDAWTDQRNVIFFGAPGTGKSHRAQEMVDEHLDLKHEPERVFRITFHPETTYFDFVGSFRPAVGWTGSQGTFQKADGTKVAHQQPVTYYAFEPGPLSLALHVAASNPTQNVALIIEEINRGNVAAIFGDVFQLLDRNQDAPAEHRHWSKYPIVPESAWAQWLQQHCGNTGVYQDRRLRLPPNLFLYATMNTSDQALFPMDTAFRRRWSMSYLPISSQHRENDIRVPRHARAPRALHWVNLRNKINDKIVEYTHVDDKRLGAWFITTTGRNDAADPIEFQSKVLFYLWSDVFRDSPHLLFRDEIKSFDHLYQRFQEGKDVFRDEFLE